MPIKVGLQYIDIWKESLEEQVRDYEKEPIEKGKIVFYGPSNFTRWSAKWEHTPLSEALLGKSGSKCAINRGFGSSCAEHQLYYYPRMIRPLEPKVLVYSPFANYSAFGYSTEENWELAQRVIAYALADFPGIHIYLCSPHRHKNDTPEIIEKRNKIIETEKNFVQSTPGCYFVDAFNHEPLGRQDIFVKDGVHYNQLGYDLYADFYKEVLKEELALY